MLDISLYIFSPFVICGAGVQLALDSVEIALTPENINNDIFDNELFENYGDSGQYGHPEPVRTVRYVMKVKSQTKTFVREAENTRIK